MKLSLYATVQQPSLEDAGADTDAGSDDDTHSVVSTTSFMTSTRRPRVEAGMNVDLTAKHDKEPPLLCFLCRKKALIMGAALAVVVNSAAALVFALAPEEAMRATSERLLIPLPPPALPQIESKPSSHPPPPAQSKPFAVPVAPHLPPQPPPPRIPPSPYAPAPHFLSAAQLVAARLNDRFEHGAPSNELAAAGVLLRQWDGLDGHTKPW